MKKLFLSLAIMSFISLSVFPQADKGTDVNTKYNTWSGTLSFGSMLFYGDLRQYGLYPVGKSPYPEDISERKWGFGLAINKQLNSAFAVQCQFQNGKLSGFKREADAYFITNFTEYGVNGIVNFRNLFFQNFAKQKISVYGILGIGFINYKSLAKTIKTSEEIYSYGYGMYGQKEKRTTEAMIPVGIGAKYKINSKFDIGLEMTMNNLFTDKLDAYVVSESAKDKYGYTCLSFAYKIGNSEKSLEWDINSTGLPAVDSRVLESYNTSKTNKSDSVVKSNTEKNNKSDNTDKTNKPETIHKKSSGRGDADHDGVPDKFDKCPNTPTYALVDENGCPYDEDQDKIPDYLDKCPGTPSDVKVDSVGCPIDSDGDRVADYLDNCPDTPKKAKVDAEGCPIDTDGDGVYDGIDKCPDTPKGTKVDEKGCPV